jgi:hypothetical protein
MDMAVALQKKGLKGGAPKLVQKQEKILYTRRHAIRVPTAYRPFDHRSQAQQT